MEETCSDSKRESRKDKSTKEAIAFYKEHNVTKVLESLLNTMFLDSPQDIYGYMSEYFHSLSKPPLISSVEGEELYDNNGDPSLSLTLHCSINGINKPVSSYVHTITSLCKDANEDGYSNEAKETDANDSVQNCLGPLDSLEKIGEILCNVCLKDQSKINNTITQDLGVSLHPSSQTAVSRLVALSLAKLSSKPLFLSLNESFEKDDDFKMSFTLPLPLIAVLAGGITKLKIQGFYLLPSPFLPLFAGIQNVINMYRELGRALASKQGPAATSVNGTYYYTSDKPEVIMELLRDLGIPLGIELNKDVMVIVDVGGANMYDEDKNKYEFASGQWKTGDELVNILSNLATAFPGLIGFIDPLHPKDVNSWKLLMEQVGSTSLLIADRTLPDLPLIKENMVGSSEKSSSPVSDTLSHISCTALSVCHNQSLDKCFDEAAHLRGLSTYYMFSTQQAYTHCSISFDVDLAVALNCKFIKVNAPVGTTSTVVLSRLKEIERLLESLRLQVPSSTLIFPSES